MHRTSIVERAVVVLERVTARSPGGRWTPVVACTIALVVASIVPSPFERRSEWERVGPDKLLHLVGHAGYAVVLAEALAAGRARNATAAALAVCLSTAHSLVTGRLQAQVPGRAFELADVLAGLVGATLAALGWYVASADARTRPSAE